MKYLSYISTTLLGLVFLVSAFAKAWDAEAFADMLLLYGPKWFSVGAPLIIGVEAVMGMFLLLRISPRRMAVLADCFLVIVSGIFAYGVLTKGITDCGCFGALSKLYTGKPWTTFARNAVLLLVSIPALKYRTDTKPASLWQVIATMCVTAAACFICGLAMRPTFELPRWRTAVKTDSRTETLNKLNALYPFDSDSTYFVYLFSFSCIHCQNYYANVEQYQKMHVADKVIGIAVEDEQAQERFYRVYQPEIEIRTISHRQMADITGSLPVGYFIRENAIQYTQSGSVFAPGILMQ